MTTMQKLLIIGATSAIAEATARRFALRGYRLHLLGRNGDDVQSVIEALVRPVVAAQGVGDSDFIEVTTASRALLT